MIPEWKLHVLITGYSHGDRTALMIGIPYGTPVDAPIVAVAIEGNGHKIVVDTGYHDPQWVTDNVVKSSRTEEQKIENILKDGLGWSVDDVDTVINTHLHYDHCGANKLFKNATFYVSALEWEIAFDPIATQKAVYLPELFDYRAVNYFQWQFVEGETEIFPGIIMFPTPGHTPGHMSVLVNTAEGPVCVTGDECNTVQNLQEGLQNTIQSNTYDYVDSLAEIKKRTNCIIPGHEPTLKNLQSSNFPKVQF